jgi:hypothetical protein
VVEPKNQFCVLSNAMLPPHGAYPLQPLVWTVLCQDELPVAPMPPDEPNPASPPPRDRVPTNTLIVFAAIDGLEMTVCVPVAGSKNVTDQVFPPEGVMAERFVVMLLPRSVAACWRTARAWGLFAKNPVSYE